MTKYLNEVEREVMTAQQLFWTALQTKDAALFDKVLAEDFVSRSPGQANESRAGFIKTLTSFPATVLTVESENVEIHLFGDMAVLSGVQAARLSFANEDEILNRIAITNIFRHIADRWQMVLAHTVELSTIP